MGILEIFSKRQKKLRGEAPDVYTYDAIPRALKVQIIHIWRETLGNEDEYAGPKSAYRFIVETLRKEYGVFVLPGTQSYVEVNPFSELANFLLQEQDAERALDAIELSFRVIDRATRNWDYRHRQDASEQADDAIQELNARFREHGVNTNLTMVRSSGLIPSCFTSRQ